MPLCSGSSKNWRRMSERWFFALWPDLAVSRSLAELRPVLHYPKARWSHPLDLHLTLAFLGELTPAELACAEAAAGRVSASAFPVSVDTLGVFRRSRVLWCGPSQASTGLLDLVERLQSQLTLCGFEPEGRPYRAHLTLARGVSQPPPPVPFFGATWVARDFALACGRPRQSPRYEIRRRWGLAESDWAD